MAAYWGIISTVVFIAIYYFVNIEYAKKLSLEFMLFIEKKAEEFALTEGAQKKEWVIAQYDILPTVIKTVISKETYKAIVQTMFDEAMKKLTQ